jgi:hypothetical protein
VAGVDVERADAPVTELDREHARDAVHRRLGGGVGQSPAALADRRGRVAGGGVGGDVDDRAAAGLQHRRQGGLGDGQLGEVVGLHLHGELLERGLEERRHAPAAGVHGIVDEDVDAAERRQRLGYCGMHGRERQQVGDQRKCPAAALLDHPGRRLETARQRAIRAGVALVASFAFGAGTRGERHVEPRLG